MEAARVAGFLAWDYGAMRGAHAVANGWLQRARRLVEDLPPSAEHAWLPLIDGLGEVAVTPGAPQGLRRQAGSHNHWRSIRMLCAHTVRRLKPGTFDQFSAAFMPLPEDAPAGWVRFHMLRSLSDENEVVTFGFFDGTLEELEGSQAGADYGERRASIDGFVESVVANGVYEIVESLVQEPTPS